MAPTLTLLTRDPAQAARLAEHPTPAQAVLIESFSGSPVSPSTQHVLDHMQATLRDHPGFNAGQRGGDWRWLRLAEALLEHAPEDVDPLPVLLRWPLRVSEWRALVARMPVGEARWDVLRHLIGSPYPPDDPAQQPGVVSLWTPAGRAALTDVVKILAQAPWVEGGDCLVADGMDLHRFTGFAHFLGMRLVDHWLNLSCDERAAWWLPEAAGTPAVVCYTEALATLQGAVPWVCLPPGVQEWYLQMPRIAEQAPTGQAVVDATWQRLFEAGLGLAGQWALPDEAASVIESYGGDARSNVSAATVRCQARVYQAGQWGDYAAQGLLEVAPLAPGVPDLLSGAGVLHWNTTAYQTASQRAGREDGRDLALVVRGLGLALTQGARPNTALLARLEHAQPEVAAHLTPWLLPRCLQSLPASATAPRPRL